MPLVTVVLILLAVGIFLALINRFGPPYVDATMLKIINVVVIIAVIIWLMNVFGVWAYLSRITVG